jgi:predicted SprT family Zn-dependent metalloprotease
MIFALFRKKKKKTLRLYSEGEHYNLNKIYAKVNKSYFEGKLDLKISWFGNHCSKARRRVILGSYNHQKGLIKINRVLDHSHIPDHFISFIVYHEMLHHVLPPLKRRYKGRRIHHSAFSAREKEFKEFELVQEFRKGFVKELFKGG